MEKFEGIMDYVNRNRKIFQLILGVLIAVLLATEGLMAQNTEGYIYGKVYTRDNTYEGQLRWGKEEAYWHDHFNASKTENPNARSYERYRDRERDNDSWRDIDWRISSIWEDRAQTVHQFGCQFGDIQEIRNYGNNRLVIKLKNGEDIRLSGSGYNDVGTDIRVLDNELGQISVDWDRIDKIEFLPTPKNLRRTMGDPVYGKVETYRKGTFEGFVIWDHDERLGKDKLDGDSRDGDVSITFDNIRRIEQRGGGSNVELKSGRTMYLTGSNDVNNGNRGVIVTVEGMGRVDIPWRDFVAVDFIEPKGAGLAYSNYTTPKGLFGKVIKYEGGEVDGRIIFDLDEEYEIEILEGKDDELEYAIPFRHIKKIAPKNYHFSQIDLRNGETILLGEGRDVSKANGGVLVYRKGLNEPEYIEWRNITEIVFD